MVQDDRLACSADARYDVRLASRAAGGAWLLAPLRPSGLAVEIDPDDPLEIVELPGHGTQPDLRARFADPSGALLAFDGNVLHVRSPGGGWAAYLVPQEMSVRAASIQPDGRPWIAGARPPRHPHAQARDAALMRWSAREQAFIAATPQLPAIGGWRALRHNCLQAFRGLETSGYPPVVWSDSADPASARSCLFVGRGRSPWRVLPLPRRVRDVIRSAAHGLLVVTAEGELLSVQARAVSRIVSAVDLRAAFVRASRPPPESRFILRGADAAGDELVVVAGLYSTQPGGALIWHMTGALHSVAGGGWKAVMVTSPQEGEPELLDVALVRGGR